MREMFIPCIPCLKTKGFIKEITSHIKGLSLKVSGAKEQSNTVYPVNQQNVDFDQFLRQEATGSKEEQEDTVSVEVKYEESEEREAEEHEWMSEPEPGVLITLVQLPHGGNLLKKISFSKELFDEWQAEIWWRENWEKIVGLYSISQISSSQAACPSSEQENQIGAEEATCSSGQGKNSWYHLSGSRDEVSVESSEEERDEEAEAAEWVVEDEPGVFVFLRSLPDGSRKVVCAELMGENFGRVKARVWWEENKERLQKFYS